MFPPPMVVCLCTNAMMEEEREAKLKVDEISGKG